MKKVLGFLLCLILSSCLSHEVTLSEGSSVVGKWKLVEVNIGIGPAGEWEPVEQGEIYQLNSDGTFSLSANSGCTSESYEINANILDLTFDCPGSNPLSYRYTLEKSYLTLSPAKVMCIEGCLYKFERL